MFQGYHCQSGIAIFAHRKSLKITLTVLFKDNVFPEIQLGILAVNIPGLQSRLVMVTYNGIK